MGNREIFIEYKILYNTKIKIYTGINKYKIKIKNNPKSASLPFQT